MNNNNLIEFKPYKSSRNSQDLEELALNEIWSGIKSYLKKKSSSVDARTDIYYMTYAYMLGILCFAQDQLNDPESSIRATKMVSVALTNAIDKFNNDSYSKRSQSN